MMKLRDYLKVELLKNPLNPKLNVVEFFPKPVRVLDYYSWGKVWGLAPLFLNYISFNSSLVLVLHISDISISDISRLNYAQKLFRLAFSKARCKQHFLP